MANANATTDANVSTDANATTPTVLAPYVLLAFDDFSLAGRHLLHHLHLDGAASSPLTSSALPETLAPYVRVTQYAPQTGQTTLSVVTVATATVRNTTALWAIADALVQWFSANDVATLRIVASLHLPQAKSKPTPTPHGSTALLATVYGSPTENSLLPFDAAWDITDAFLVRLLHCARVEQAFATALMVVKGYRPGRDGAGMRDALAALAAALPLVVSGVSVDMPRAEADASKAALTQAKGSEQGLGLLYQ